MRAGGRLTQRGVRLSTLGFGAAPIAGLYSAVDEDAAAATVDAAWEAGVRYFDTAPHYGLGTSERRLGAALRGRDRADYVLSTKVGRVLVADDGAGRTDAEGDFAVPATHRRVWDLSRDGIRRSFEDSLRRLGTDRIDLLYLHDPEHHLTEALTTAAPAMAELRDEGAVRAIGAGSKDSTALARLVRDGDMDAVMVAGRYTLLEQPASDELLPACDGAGVDVVAAGVFNSGVLATHAPAGPPDASARYEYGPVPEHVAERVRRLGEVCARYDVTVPQAAIAYVLRNPLVSSAVLGMRSAGEVAQNAGRWKAGTPRGLWDALRAEGLLP